MVVYCSTDTKHQMLHATREVEKEKIKKKRYYNLPVKGKPFERMGRKATGLNPG